MSSETTIPGSPEAVVDAILQGGPADIPADQRMLPVATDAVKVRVKRLGGYEHFERADGAQPAAGEPVVFRWTMRTRIAE